jgi:hypothetical protein
MSVEFFAGSTKCQELVGRQVIRIFVNLAADNYLWVRAKDIHHVGARSCPAAIN